MACGTPSEGLSASLLSVARADAGRPVTSIMPWLSASGIGISSGAIGCHRARRGDGVEPHEGTSGGGGGKASSRTIHPLPSATDGVQQHRICLYE